MKIIELEKWTPSADDPRRREYAGQRTAQEVFEELKYRLESQGYLTDEYFLRDSHNQHISDIRSDKFVPDEQCDQHFYAQQDQKEDQIQQAFSHHITLHLYPLRGASIADVEKKIKERA